MNFYKNKFWFSKKESRIKSGFSLIEMVVVIGSFGIIIVAVISTILLTFRSQNKVVLNNKLGENGVSILMELRRNILDSDSKNIVCDAGGTSVMVINRNDKKVTNLICSDNKIASVSTETVYLNSNEVLVSSCQDFVSCKKNTDLSEVVRVDFNFGLGTSVAGVNSTQFFDASVTTRN